MYTAKWYVVLGWDAMGKLRVIHKKRDWAFDDAQKEPGRAI